MENKYRARILILSAADQEPLSVAKELQRQLDYDYQPTLWTQGVFRAGRSAYESFAKEVDNNAYGIFVLTPDDKLVSRGKEFEVPRMNVVFELGYFAAKHGIHRAFLLMPRGHSANYLSDLAGIQPADFDLDRFRSGEREAALGAAVSAIESAIRADQLQYPQQTQGRNNILCQQDGGSIFAGTSYCLAAKLGSGHEIRVRITGTPRGAQDELITGWTMSFTPSPVAWDHSIGIQNGIQSFWASGPSEPFTEFKVSNACKELFFEIFENAEALNEDDGTPSRTLRLIVS